MNLQLENCKKYSNWCEIMQLFAVLVDYWLAKIYSGYKFHECSALKMDSYRCKCPQSLPCTDLMTDDIVPDAPRFPQSNFNAKLIQIIVIIVA